MHKLLFIKAYQDLTGHHGVAGRPQVQYHRTMAVAQLLQAWRISRGYSVDDLAAESHLQPHLLEEIEAGEVDPSASLLEALADALKIPPAWLFSHPTSFHILFNDPEENTDSIPPSPDPVIERILAGSQMDRSLYVLLTAIMQSGEPKLLRAAEVNLRSLVKQAKQATIPWQNRPSGHFEPPSD
ncbi:MAG TPA: helix-turn-helix domain-containing protein [Nitrospiraceae bacterium]|nr:helix-turn-helix domain-containing protein [Nitrospiraceae bacterium]